jgi:hypothetical protein
MKKLTAFAALCAALFLPVSTTIAQDGIASVYSGERTANGE